MYDVRIKIYLTGSANIRPQLKYKCPWNVNALTILGRIYYRRICVGSYLIKAIIIIIITIEQINYKANNYNNNYY